MLDLAKKLLAPFRLGKRRKKWGVPEVTAEERSLVVRFGRYSMTPPFRMWTLLKAVEYVENCGLDGDIVECGVWRGGNVMLAKAVSKSQRRFWLYDTFAGMTEPTEHDVSAEGRVAIPVQAARQKQTHNEWAYASLDEVRQYFADEGLLDESLIFREGRVEDTLTADTADIPERISILRLDTDWYESTLIELKMLYPRLVVGGVLILDDYGRWLGSKKAVHEYFGANCPLLIPVDRRCRMVIKTAPIA